MVTPALLVIGLVLITTEAPGWQIAGLAALVVAQSLDNTTDEA